MGNILSILCDDMAVSPRNSNNRTSPDEVPAQEFIGRRSSSRVTDASSEEYLDKARKLESRLEGAVDTAVEQAGGLTSGAQELYGQIKETVQQRTEDFISSLVDEITSVLPDVASVQATESAQEQIEHALNQEQSETQNDTSKETDAVDQSSDLMDLEYEVEVGDSVYSPKWGHIYKVKDSKGGVCTVTSLREGTKSDITLGEGEWVPCSHKVSDSSSSVIITTAPGQSQISVGDEVSVSVSGSASKAIVVSVSDTEVSLVNTSFLEPVTASPNVVWAEATEEVSDDPTEATGLEYEGWGEDHPDAVAEAEAILSSENQVTDAKMDAALLNAVPEGATASTKYMVKSVELDKGFLNMGKLGVVLTFDKEIPEDFQEELSRILKNTYKSRAGKAVDIKFTDPDKVRVRESKVQDAVDPEQASTSELELIASSIARIVGYWVTTRFEELASNADPEVHKAAYLELFDELSSLSEGFSVNDETSRISFRGTPYMFEDNNLCFVGNTSFLYQVGEASDAVAQQVSEAAATLYISIANVTFISDAEDDILSDEAKAEILNKVEAEVKDRLEKSGISIGDAVDYVEQLRTAEKETNVNPTEEEKLSGNYAKGKFSFLGILPITIEQPQGSIRSGVDEDGKEWSQEMKHTYGYFDAAEGPDGDEVDCFIGPNLESREVFVVDQLKSDGSFDEYKVMLGFDDAEHARTAYLSNYEEGWSNLGDITHIDVDTLKRWLESADRREKPFTEYLKVEDAMDPNEDRDGDVFLNWSQDQLTEYLDRVRKRKLSKEDREALRLSDSVELTEELYSDLEKEITDHIKSEQVPAPLAEVHTSRRNTYDIAHTPTTFSAVRDSASVLDSHLSLAAIRTSRPKLSVTEYQSLASTSPQDPYVQAVADSAMAMGDLDLFTPYVYKRKLTDSTWVAPNVDQIAEAFDLQIPQQFTGSPCLVSTRKVDYEPMAGVVVDSVLEFNYDGKHTLYVAPFHD